MLHPKPSDLLNPSRFFVREGDLQMWNKKKSKKSTRHFFLFNDIMLLCKKQGSKRFFLRIHVTLRSPYVTTESIDSSGNTSEFRLHCKTRSFILYASSDEERKQWLKDLQNSIAGTHPEENKGKEEKTTVASLPAHMKKPTAHQSDGEPKTNRSQSATVAPKKKKQPSNGPNVRMSTVQPASQPMYSQPVTNNNNNQTNKPPRQKKAKDDMIVRSKSMMEGQQLTNDPGIFVYNAPTITNNPFLDLPQQNTFAGNPFATNVNNNARPVSMMMPTTTTFNTFNHSPQQRSNPFATNVSPQSTPPMSNPFATNTASSSTSSLSSNPFATNVNNRPMSTVNPFMSQPQSSPQQGSNPFATNTGY